MMKLENTFFGSDTTPTEFGMKVPPFQNLIPTYYFQQHCITCNVQVVMVGKNKVSDPNIYSENSERF